MWEKTFTFWHRLVGKAAVPSAAEANEDRRLWVRHAIDLQGNLQLAEPRESHKILAQVRDLSLGGANLLVEAPVDAGEMVILDLPAENGAIFSVLACVVRAEPQPDGRCSLGCVFSRELSSQDLHHFGAQKLPASADDDKRTWVRFACEVHAAYRKVGDPTDEAFTAHVLNISANGIGLAVAQPLAAGSLLNVDLLDKVGSVTRTMLACIVHATKRGPGDYAVGCNFIRELAEEEIQALL